MYVIHLCRYIPYSAHVYLTGITMYVNLSGIIRMASLMFRPDCIGSLAMHDLLSGVCVVEVEPLRPWQ